MSGRAGRAIGVAELAGIVAGVDPEAIMVPRRILARVIRRDRDRKPSKGGGGRACRDGYAVAGASLSGSVDREELGLSPWASWPERALLLARPEPEELAGVDRAVALRDAWRLLFHARAAVAVEARLDAEGAGPEGVIARVERIGRVEFEEARAVLEAEGRLLPGSDDRSTYVEFAATYLELARFAPALLPHTFPGLADRDDVDKLPAADAGADALLAATRPPGAAEPTSTRRRDPETEPEPEAVDEPGGVPRRAYPRLLRRAEANGAKGNVVRAAVLLTQAALSAGPRLAARARDGARLQLDLLAGRLGAAMGADPAEVARWGEALPALLGRSARGFWRPEARLLYDLQKACVDHEREVFAVDLIEWARSLGRRPIRRSLPMLREVLTYSHLRDAARRLRDAQLGRADRERLAGLLGPAVHRAEEALRLRFRPVIEGALEENGMRPANYPERVARRKLVEELLDRILERGFLRMSDLRDACSRGNLKLPDLSGPGEFFGGDRLLNADESLALALDGVYRRGEIYLRWLQRANSLAFATRTGRFLTLFVALPYGGAFVALEGLQHLIGPVVHYLTGVHVHIMTPVTVLTVGTLAMALVNFPGFRKRALAAGRAVGRGVHLTLIVVPRRLLRLRLVRLTFDGLAARLVWRYALKPALALAPFWSLWAAWMSRQFHPLAAVGALALAGLLLNSKPGRRLEEIAVDGAGRAVHGFIFDLIPGLFRLIMESFDRMLEGVERLLYAVDEWLRFRSGQRRPWIAAKAVLGVFWFAVTYLVRIYVVLLIEPQVNPIKHFPVVTVSHKIILPLSLTITRIIAAPLVPVLGTVIGNFIAGATVLLLPGVFGFLVWELKENWRLYEANRPSGLRPVPVGHHGESLKGMLRPGFHSGTLPKIFARLRKAERRAAGGGSGRPARKHLATLHHAEESIRRFVDRDFLALLAASRSLGPAGVGLGAVDLSTNRIRVELTAEEFPGESLPIAFEYRSGRIVAGIDDQGWLPRLNDARRRTLANAIAGLYKMGDVDHVRDQSEVDDPGDDAEVLNGVLARPDARRHLFGRMPIPWSRWVEAWEREHAGPGGVDRLIEGVGLLPAADRPRRRRRPAGGRRP